MSNPQLATKTTTTHDTNQVSQTTYQYDQYNNITDQKDYDWGSNGQPGPLLRETQTAYNTSASYIGADLVRLPSQIRILDGSGAQVAETVLDYDENPLQDAPGIVGHDSGYGTGFGTRGNVTSKWDWLKTASYPFVATVMTYDIAGNVHTLQDPNGNTTTLTYNDDGRSEYAFVTLTKNALNQVPPSSAQYDYNIGKPTDTYDLNGAHTHYDYTDALDRLTKVTLPTGAQTAFSYPSVTEIDTYQDQNSAGDQALRTRQFYDGLGRVSETDNYESSSQYIATTQTYDASGRPASTTNPSRPGDGLNYATTYTYDSLGRVTSLQGPDGSTTATGYYGNQTTVTDAAQHARRSIMDALGRLTQVAEDPNGLNYSTVYAYDPIGDLLSVTQGAQTRTFAYDTLGRLTSATNPESGTVSYTYDSDGNVLTRKDNRGITTTYSYEALNRLKTKTYSDSTPPVNYTYDPNIGNGKGWLGSVSNHWSTTNYAAYDPLGNVLASNQVTAGQTYGFSYSYNLAGALLNETYPSGRVVTNAYDSANRVNNVTGSLSGQPETFAYSISYAPHGAIAGMWYQNQVAHSAQFNNRLQPSFMQAAGSNLSSNMMLQLNWNWGSTNNNGNLYGLTASHSGPGYPQALSFNQTFTYDGVNRLSSAADSSGWSRNFGYDQYCSLNNPDPLGAVASTSALRFARTQ